MARNRSRVFSEQVGNHYGVLNSSTPIVSSAIDSTVTACGSETMTDYLSHRPHPDQQLDYTHYRIRRPRLFGTVPNFKGDSAKTWKLTMNGKRFGDFASPYGAISLPSKQWGYYTTKALANINPNNAAIDIPLFVFELKDIPHLIHGLGNFVMNPNNWRHVPDSWLAYRFGWAPLVNDLAALFALSESLEARKNYLRAISRKGGKKVQRRLGSTKFTVAATANDGITFDGASCGSFRWQTAEGTEDWWFTCNVKLTSSIPGPDLGAAAFKAAFGFSNPISTVWNALPWSWLFDYFANIGTFLEATGGLINYRPSKLNLMCHQHVRVESEERSNKGFAFSPGSKEAFYKGRRQPVMIPLIWPESFLTSGQIANIGAIVSRWRPYR